MEEQKTQNSPAAKNTFLECERDIVFILMMLVAGYFGAFTYSIRGGVFCNAQTGNFVLLAMALGNGRWFHALYFFIPITAYCVGTMLSEVLPGHVKKSHLIRWDTLLILIEILVVIFLGFLPESAPVQITQVLINFICSMQYNTFRQAAGGNRSYKIYPSSPGTAFPSAETADPYRHAPCLCFWRRSFYFPLPLFPGKSHLVFPHSSWLCPGRPSLCRSGKRKRTVGSDTQGTLT